MEIIAEEKINEIRNAADIVSIISDYIPLKMQGKNYFGVCPFHDDHSPSMSVSPERQLYKCFVCNNGGNVFHFVQNYENISFVEAVKRVADKVGIPLNIGTISKENSKYKLEYEIMNYASKIFQNNLNSKEGINAKEYLSSRNITDNIIKDFNIGLSLSDKTYLYNVLSKKYDLNKLDELGLITKDGINGYDKFINRIMIPITDINNHVVGFTGRIFNNEKDMAKYINTKETVIYRKGNILFNYYNAKDYIRNEKCAVLVEGNMDAIRMYSEGIRNVIALMGTAMTKEQVNILKKLRVPIILMFDNDDAGSLATITNGDLLTNNGVECKVVRLSGAKDPDEYIIKYGKDKFIETIKFASNYFDYKLDYLKNNKNLNRTEDLVKYVKDVLKMLDNKDNLTKEITLKKLSEEYNIDLDILKKEISLEEKKDILERPSIIRVRKSKYERYVENILYYMMSDKKYLLIFNKQLGFLQKQEERELVSEIEHYIKVNGKINYADFLSYAENMANIRDIVNTINKSNINFDDELKDEIFMEYINGIKEINDKESVKKIKKKKKNETDINKQIEMLNEIVKIKKGSVKNARN